MEELAKQRDVVEVYCHEGGTAGWREAGLPIAIPERPTTEEETSATPSSAPT